MALSEHVIAEFTAAVVLGPERAPADDGGHWPRNAVRTVAAASGSNPLTRWLTRRADGLAKRKPEETFSLVRLAGIEPTNLGFGGGVCPSLQSWGYCPTLGTLSIMLDGASAWIKVD